MDSTQQKYTDGNGYDENSLFEWNKDQTMFNHTIAGMQSAYYVKSKVYDKENNVWIYDVVSDVGIKYRYCFDEKNKEVRATFKPENRWTMLTFWVKAVF